MMEEKLFKLKRWQWSVIGLFLLVFSFYVDGEFTKECLDKECSTWIEHDPLNFDIIKEEISPNFYYVSLDFSALLMMIGVIMFFTSILFWNYVLYGSIPSNNIRKMKGEGK